jgi:hypothetical protein
MLPDAGDRSLQTRTGGILCPRCGRPIVLLVGRLGPCEICERELAEARDARRAQAVAETEPHPCEVCGREIAGRRARYCGGTCRTRAWRRRAGAA